MQRWNVHDAFTRAGFVRATVGVGHATGDGYRRDEPDGTFLHVTENVDGVYPPAPGLGVAVGRYRDRDTLLAGWTYPDPATALAAIRDGLGEPDARFG